MLFLVVSFVNLFQVVVAAAAEDSNSGRLVDIGSGRKMYLECRGTGSPTVVLVGGLRASADDWSISDKSKPAVFFELAKFTRVCTYDRPGTPVGEKPSRSDPAPQPTTAKDAVTDLHSLLAAAGEKGPYLFVGHSYGGLIVRLYASTYPKETSGLVLVDALSEGLQDAETAEQWATQRKLIEGDVSESVALYPALERVDVDRSFKQIRGAPPLPPIPLIVMSADRPWGPQVPALIAAGKVPADVPPDFGYVTDAAQKKAQKELAKLVPDAKQITNTDSGHEIHKEQPQLVIDAIRQVVDAVRSGSHHVVVAAAAEGSNSGGLVDIGRGRKMYLECRGSGSPTVVLISGKGNRADIWTLSNPEKPGPIVFPEVARFTRVCAYDRPGTTGALASEPSRSDPVPEPVTVANGVSDLHALLTASKEAGPFVLVGHSIGGLISRLYASTYPTDVSGLVLIDALSEDLYKRLTPEQQAVFEKLNDVPEKYDNVRSFEQVRAAPSVRAMPVVVLTADRPPITRKDIASGRFPPDVTAKFADALWAAQVPAQDSLAKLFPNAKHITKTNSSHYIQIVQPQLVIDSIREVVDAVRNSGASPRNETGNELPPIAESSRIALEKALDEAFTKSALPGVITGLWIPGTGSWIASRGVSDLKTKAPMTAHLQAPIGSITKSLP